MIGYGDDVLDQFGAWMLEGSDNPCLGEDSTVAMEDALLLTIPGLSGDVNMQGSELDAIIDQPILTTTMTAPGFPSVDMAQVNLAPNPNASSFTPQMGCRPQLQVDTSALALQPSNPAYNVELPRSAPAIRVDEPDRQEALNPSTALSPLPQSRRRAVSAAPMLSMPTLQHSLSAPSIETLAQGALLSPESARARLSAPWDPYSLTNNLANLDSDSSSRPATPCSRVAQSSSRGRSISRSRSPSGSSRASSAASTAHSSVNGAHACPEATCQKRFPSVAKLNHHTRYHTPYDQRPIKCDHPNCNSRFLFKRELQRHKKRITHQEPQYHCSICDRSFGREDHLDRHMDVHSRSRTPSSASLPVTPMTTGPATQSEMPPAAVKGHPGTSERPQINNLSAFPPLPHSPPAINMDVDPFTTFTSGSEWTSTFPATTGNWAWNVPQWPSQ